MSDEGKKRLLILGTLIVVFLLLFRWRQPETAKEILNSVTNGFQFPNIGTITPIDYDPNSYVIPVGGYVPNSNPPMDQGCSLCTQIMGTANILPASPRVQIESLAASVKYAPSVPAKARTIPAFGGGGSQMSVGWIASY